MRNDPFRKLLDGIYQEAWKKQVTWPDQCGTILTERVRNAAVTRLWLIERPHDAFKTRSDFIRGWGIGKVRIPRDLRGVVPELIHGLRIQPEFMANQSVTISQAFDRMQPRLLRRRFWHR